VVQDFQRQVSQGLLRPLDELARVRLRERHAQIFTGRLPRGLLRGENVVTIMRFLGEGIEVSDQTGEILVADIRFESELVLERDRKGEDEVNGGSGMC
jgi:hypothetical protein